MNRVPQADQSVFFLIHRNVMDWHRIPGTKHSSVTSQHGHEVTVIQVGQVVRDLVGWHIHICTTHCLEEHLVTMEIILLHANCLCCYTLYYVPGTVHCCSGNVGHFDWADTHQRRSVSYCCRDCKERMAPGMAVNDCRSEQHLCPRGSITVFLLQIAT